MRPGLPVKAIVPATVGNDIYRDLAFGGGIPNLEFAGVWEGLRSSMIAASPDEPQQDPEAVAEHPVARAETLAEFDGAAVRRGRHRRAARVRQRLLVLARAVASTSTGSSATGSRR